MFTFFQNPKPNAEDNMAKAIQTRQHEAERVFNEIFATGDLRQATQPAPQRRSVPPSQHNVGQCPIHTEERERHHSHKFLRTSVRENCPEGRVRNQDGFVDGAFVLDAGGNKIGPINESVRRRATDADIPITVQVPPRRQNPRHNMQFQSPNIGPSPSIDFSKPFDFGDMIRR